VVYETVLYFLLRDADMHSTFSLSKDGWLDGVMSVTRRYVSKRENG